MQWLNTLSRAFPLFVINECLDVLQSFSSPEKSGVSWAKMMLFHSCNDGETLVKAGPSGCCACGDSPCCLSWLLFKSPEKLIDSGMSSSTPRTIASCGPCCTILFHQKKTLRPPLSWKTLLIHDYPQSFLSGLHHLLQTRSLFISAANHTSAHNKCGLK